MQQRRRAYSRKSACLRPHPKTCELYLGFATQPPTEAPWCFHYGHLQVTCILEWVNNNLKYSSDIGTRKTLYLILILKGWPCLLTCPKYLNLYYNSRNNVCRQFLKCIFQYSIYIRTGKQKTSSYSQTFTHGVLKLIQLYLRHILIPPDKNLIFSLLRRQYENNITVKKSRNQCYRTGVVNLWRMRRFCVTLAQLVQFRTCTDLKLNIFPLLTTIVFVHF